MKLVDVINFYIGGIVMKKSLFTFFLLVVMVLSIGGAVYAKSAKYRYSNGYVMAYKLYTDTIAGEGAACGETDTENEAVAFVSVFSYKNGVAKNSASKQQDYYVYLGLPAKGGNSFRSGHALKYSNGTPCGVVLYLEE